ncbi:MAG: hypothetical protein K2I25_05480, partial [Muribaculaceae bacterium]|nr:hypothetical protein [Muribaculaceae bacterium]
MKQLFLTTILAAGALIASACGGKSAGQTAAEPAAKETAAVLTDADSLYARVADQVAMGPRVSGTPGHERCIDYITRRLKAAGADVSVQDTMFAPVGSDVKAQRVRNITGRFNAGAPRHVLLLAHYDTRPWA